MTITRYNENLYRELNYKLGKNYSYDEMENFIVCVISDNYSDIIVLDKLCYIYNELKRILLTINKDTHRLITGDLLTKIV